MASTTSEKGSGAGAATVIAILVVDEGQARVHPTAGAAGQVVEAGEAVGLGQPGGRLAAHASRADEDDAVARKRFLDACAQLPERDVAGAREVAGRPFAVLADVDDVQIAVGD